jgi:glycosyltransferase involved in cell wall biosynthesis
MLSILIPVYNYSVASLVTKLHKQLVRADISFEIIVMEDGSTEIFAENRELKNLPFVQYSILPQNIGRAAIRNRLANNALYDNLLFIDCDADVDNSNYIKNYLPYLNKNIVVVGGVKYAPQTISSKNTSLRLKYGIKREEKNNYFTTFNFLAPKVIFQKTRFNETISGYGYEDTFFGAELENSGIKICCIQNKLVHTGIDENNVFLKKVETGMGNLYTLYASKKYPFFCKTSKILRMFARIERLRLTGVFYTLTGIFKTIVRKNILGKNPSLFLFDIYKFHILCKIAKNY